MAIHTPHTCPVHYQHSSHRDRWRHMCLWVHRCIFLRNRMCSWSMWVNTSSRRLSIWGTCQWMGSKIRGRTGRMFWDRISTGSWRRRSGNRLRTFGKWRREMCIIGTLHTLRRLWSRSLCKPRIYPKFSSPLSLCIRSCTKCRAVGTLRIDLRCNTKCMETCTPDIQSWH